MADVALDEDEGCMETVATIGVVECFGAMTRVDDVDFFENDMVGTLVGMAVVLDSDSAWNYDHPGVA